MPAYYGPFDPTTYPVIVSSPPYVDSSLVNPANPISTKDLLVLEIQIQNVPQVDLASFPGTSIWYLFSIFQADPTLNSPDINPAVYQGAVLITPDSNDQASFTFDWPNGQQVWVTEFFEIDTPVVNGGDNVPSNVNSEQTAGNTQTATIAFDETDPPLVSLVSAIQSAPAFVGS